jgi:hypothetical protein
VTVADREDGSKATTKATAKAAARPRGLRLHQLASLD